MNQAANLNGAAFSKISVSFVPLLCYFSEEILRRWLLRSWLLALHSFHYSFIIRLSRLLSLSLSLSLYHRQSQQNRIRKEPTCARFS